MRLSFAAVVAALAFCAGCVDGGSVKGGFDDPSAISDGGIVGLTNGLAVAVVPASDEGARDIREARQRAYVELMRQLERRGCRLAARDVSSRRRPADLDRLEMLVLVNGYDIGYALALAENAVEAPQAELVVDVFDCLIGPTSGKYTVVVRVRKPMRSKPGDNPPESSGRFYRSKTPDVDMSRAVSSLFAEK